MKKIIVTPAGRADYLQLLHRHLSAQRADFDEWHLWLNTTHVPDIAFCRELATRHDWIKTVPLCIPFEQNWSIHSFFPGYADPDAVYLRLDDDIVWLQPGFVRDMFAYRLANPDYFLVYANIVNNAILTHIYQRLGAYTTAHGLVGYSADDLLGWRCPSFARKLHNEFLNTVVDGSALRRWRCFRVWRLYYAERVSINAISWLGRTFADFGGRVGRDEELWLSSDYVRAHGLKSVVFGDALCAHFAFCTQRGRPEFDEAALLARYSALAPAALT